MRSSYIENDFGQLLYLYMLNLKPVNCVELGVLDGYSTLHIAKGLEEMDKRWGIKSFFHAYDLFDEYAYKHGSKEEVKKLLEDNGVAKYVDLRKGDAFTVHQFYENDSIEFLHLDISNTGETIEKYVELWHPKIRGRGIVCIEGGSEERDNVDWMKKYNHPSIKKAISSSPIINRWYIYGTYFRFPSMTVMMKKWWDVKENGK